jgi:DNA (cytosine-5)-methyltransferase 1
LPTKEPWRGWYDAIEDLIPSLPETNFAEWQLKLLPEEFSKTAFIELTNTCRKATCREADEPASTVLASSMRRPSSTPKAFVVNGTANSKGSGVTVVSADDPMFCVTASSSKRGIRGCLLPVGLSTGRVVSMTPRALARFQTVPDWFLLPNNKKSACEIIGNGVPCLMMQRILESFHC